MNYLAHFHLAGDNRGHISGALLGDYVKGPLTDSLPTAIEQGILLHRRVDVFTDQALVDSSLHRLFPKELRRYLGIVCDLYFDHLLALDWAKYSNLDLLEYNRNIVESLNTQQTFLPEQALGFVQRLDEHKVLTLYAQADMMATIFTRTGQRLKHQNPIADAWPILQQQHKPLKDYFDAFYPKLMSYAQQQRDQFCR